MPTPHGDVRIDGITERDTAAVMAIDANSQLSELQLRAELRQPWSLLRVARELVQDDAFSIVGFVLVWHVTDEFHVLNLATRADRRRRGIARALMADILRHARARQIRRILLEVRRSNRPAIALYRSIGFFASRLRVRYYSNDEDALEMALMLDPRSGAVLAHPDELDLDR
jgi:ribosomal-protein-alanine N-acetyltransferase